MELLTLNLHKNLEWETKLPENTDFDSAWKQINNSQEDSTMLLEWDPSTIIATDSIANDAGPRIISNLPRASAYFSKSTEKAVKHNEQSKVLEQGRYLFFQTNCPNLEENPNKWLASIIEEFMREAWWTHTKTDGNFFVRLVREDNKTAVQLITKLLI